MTDLIKGAVITFKDDIRVDDAEPLLNAIRMIQGVQDVSVVQYDPSDWANRMRVSREWTDALYKLIQEMYKL